MPAFYVDNMDDMSDTATYTATVDLDISRIENLLVQWTTELKKNILVLSVPRLCLCFYIWPFTKVMYFQWVLLWTSVLFTAVGLLVVL